MTEFFTFRSPERTVAGCPVYKIYHQVSLDDFGFTDKPEKVELQHHDYVIEVSEDRKFRVISEYSKALGLEDSIKAEFDKFHLAIEYLQKVLGYKWNHIRSDMPVAAISTKTYGDERGFAVAYRQAPAESHCNLNHGYSMKFHFEFECSDLDARNWCVDYGSLKSLKDNLEEWFDHTTLVAENDPEREAFEELQRKGLAKLTIVENTGCEALATWLWQYLEEIWLPENGYAPRVRMHRVEVRETTANMAYVTRSIYN